MPLSARERRILLDLECSLLHDEPEFVEQFETFTPAEPTVGPPEVEQPRRKIFGRLPRQRPR